MRLLQSFVIVGLLSLNTAAFGQYAYTYYQPSCATGTCPQQVQYVQAPVRYVVQPQGQYVQPAAYAPQAAPATGCDAAGFLGWLNGVRAAYGLCAVGYDANLEYWAAQNNAAQLAHGLGHWVMGTARRQNAAWNTGFPGPAWMASPGHQSALLDPTIRWIGIAFTGAYCTFSAN